MAGEFIQKAGKQLKVPDDPIIPFIKGDGIGPEIWAAARGVFDTAVAKAYDGDRRVEWQEELAGETAFKETGQWLPDKTSKAIEQGLIAIKGPLTTPIGKGHRSINVQLRQQFDLYACVRPVKYYTGTPAPVVQPEKVDMVVFRENTEDIYAGIEYRHDQSQALEKLLKDTDQLSKVRFPKTSNYGIKPISKEGSERFVVSAIEYALRHHRQKLTLVHKGNIMKFTEGAFKQWGYDIAEAKFADKVFTMQQYDKIKTDQDKAAADEALETAQQQGKIIINDIITDNFFQQALLNPANFDVIATCNLNGDYISDALAAQVGGIGIAPSANINYETGKAIFEATHGTAPQFAGQNKLNPTSIILSGAMMFEYLGWKPVADLIYSAVEQAIAAKHVTWDFASKISGATQLSTSGFGEYLQDIIKQTEKAQVG